MKLTVWMLFAATVCCSGNRPPAKSERNAIPPKDDERITLSMANQIIVETQQSVDDSMNQITRSVRICDEIMRAVTEYESADAGTLIPPPK